MKALELKPNETWRDCIMRLVTDPELNRDAFDPDVVLEEFDHRVELGEPEADVAWSVAEGYGLLDYIDCVFSDEREWAA
jgi:hypothetical protein